MTSQEVTGKRRYHDACAAAHALDMLGERWAMLVLRELMFGPKRFSELRADIPTISANLLTQRLEGLEASGLVARRKLPPPVSAQVYELTLRGCATEPILQALGRWGAGSPVHDPSLPISATSLLLSLRAMLDPTRVKALDVRIGFRLGGRDFVGALNATGLAIVRGEVGDVDLLFDGAPTALAAAVYGAVPLDRLEAQGSLTVTGPRWLAKLFTTLFPLPPKVG